MITQLRSQDDNTPPLDKADLDFVLSCYRSLQARRPELAQAEILQNIDDELKRTHLVEEERRFYREAIAGATQIGQVAAVLNMAARRGDVDGLIELGERYERLQAGRSQSAFTNGSFSFMGPGLSMCQGMSAAPTARHTATSSACSTSTWPRPGGNSSGSPPEPRATGTPSR